MLQNIPTNFSRHQRSTEEFANTTATIPNIICDEKEDNLRDTINSNPTVNTDVDDIFSSYHDKYIATNLTHNTSDVIDISSGDIVTTDNSLAPNSQKELTQQICDAADMACKAKRVNQLMSYVSGFDYSEKQDIQITYLSAHFASMMIILLLQCLWVYPLKMNPPGRNQFH